MDLTSLAALKIELDNLQEKYDTEVTKYKDLYPKGTEIKDSGGVLGIKLTPSSKRTFNIQGVREVFGTKADICIEEKVEASKFDALAKTSGEYTITKEDIPFIRLIW